MTDAHIATSDRKSLLDRALSIVADVRAGEGVGALLLATNLFMLLGCYYVLKTVRESLILTEGGAEVKSYAAAGQALILLGFVPLYGMLASRVARTKLIVGMTLFFVLNLLAFYSAGSAGASIGIAFFLWIGIFNVVAPAQLWAFANDIYSSERGKRLFPIVGLGSSLGAWVGAKVAETLFASMGAYRLLLFSAIGLALSVPLTIWIARREQHQDPARNTEAPLAKTGGFQLVLSQRYLLLIALVVLVVNIVNTVGEFLLGRLVIADAATAIANGTANGLSQEALIGQFYGNFFGWVNLLGFLFQLLLVSRLFKWIGVRGALFVLPLVATFSYSLLTILPLLAVVSVAKTLENATDYSIWNTVRQALFLPTSREAKYKAKQAIDSFFWRAGDLLQAGIVFVGVSLAFDIRGFALVNLCLVAIWLLLCVGIAREHRKLTADDDVAKKAA